MSLRALTLMMVLGLHATASAATGLFHLCGGEARLQARCCCGKGAEGKQGPGMQALADECCETLAVDHTASPSATPDAEKRWEAPRLLSLAVATSAAPELALDTFPVTWVRARGVSRATAPPLYLQHCSYLI
ncbi:MAG: hypothetical protein L0Y66_06905 [Myxococcaceae bacterium]|nr:hypothetical protein [Myxococcaceae bacterium]MCI0669970.1 hypothetical protein [Myxococcaceae bacterium]